MVVMMGQMKMEMKTPSSLARVRLMDQGYSRQYQEDELARGQLYTLSN